MQEQLSFDTPPAGTADRRGPDPASRTVVYTDGACSKNPGPGGWAWAVPGGPWARGAAPATTNQRMELQAALEAVRAIPGALEVVSDSTYVVNCFRDRWWAGWKQRNWRNSQKQPVANRDLWEPLVDEVLARDVRFRWVKGHSTDPVNDFVDRLAVESARTQSAASGTEGAPEQRPADRATRTPNSSPYRTGRRAADERGRARQSAKRP